MPTASAGVLAAGVGLTGPLEPRRLADAIVSRYMKYARQFMVAMEKRTTAATILRQRRQQGTNKRIAGGRSPSLARIHCINCDFGLAHRGECASAWRIVN